MIERAWVTHMWTSRRGEVTACRPGRVSRYRFGSGTHVQPGRATALQPPRGRKAAHPSRVPGGRVRVGGLDRAQRSAGAAGVSDPWFSGSPDAAANRKENRARGQVPANRAPARTCWRRKTGRRSMVRSIIGRGTDDVKPEANSRWPGRTLSPRRLSERSRWSPRSAPPSIRRERASPKSPGTSVPNASPA
jgi:hypothetical protein